MTEVSSFNIRSVIIPVCGYLFKPDASRYSGEYVLSLFDDSER